jgi:glucan 1,3-beta-glucosidase
MANPRPVVRVGIYGQTGYVEWSDMIVSTRGGTAGAKGIEWNLATTSGTPSGMWDVHVRIGGFTGTNLQLSQCPTFAGSTNVIRNECIAAYMSMHITASAEGLFQENCWMWVADHDIEDSLNRQITVFAGRGLLIESTAGRIWLSASGVEHHVLYQYQLLNTKNIYMGQIQTETPYFQPNPPATMPFSPVSAIRDPDFVTDCKNLTGGPPCEMAWGLRVLGSQNITIFGAGLYSFFNNYSDSCCQPDSGTECQDRIFDIKDSSSRQRVTGLETYSLNTIGTVRMITRYGTDVALAKDNTAGFVDTVAVYYHG